MDDSVTVDACRCSVCVVAASLLIALTLHPVMAQAVAFKRGERVREKIQTLPSEPQRVGMVVTVIAEPGDNIEVRNEAIFVNKQPVTGFSAELIATAARSSRMPGRMGETQYLVMGESRDPLNNVVRKWGVYSSGELERATVEHGR